MGRLKVCKVAGPGVPVGTTFTFTTSGNQQVTVPAGPAPGGFCTVGPAFAVGSTITVTENLPNGTQVINITANPGPRLVSSSGNTATVLIGSGVTEVTFTNKRTGFFEVCKNAGHGIAPGTPFTFYLNNGSLGPFTVLAGSCSPAIEVPAGNVIINEVVPLNSHLVGCSTLLPNSSYEINCNPANGTSTVKVDPGDVSTQTTAFLTNAPNHDLPIDDPTTPQNPQ
jgi:hypothetical protein